MQLDTAKHALVTGGASGIGLGIARALRRRDIAVTILDANADNLAAVEAAEPGLFRTLRHDVRDRAGWVQVKAEAEAALGPVDILVNNAGIAPSGHEVADMDPAHFDQIVAINLIGVFNGAHAFAADMRERGRGHIVNTASMAGLSDAGFSATGYSASKFGVVGFTEALRREMAQHGVGVSALCPGLVATSLFENTAKIGGQLKFEGLSLLAAPQTPDQLALLVLKGIEEDAPYIFSDLENWAPKVEQRIAALQEALQKARAAAS